MSDSGQLRQTALFAEHQALGAKLIPFSGWSMPVQYRSIVEEHLHTRQHVGLFDIGHMGEFKLKGPSVARCLDRLITTQPSTIADGKCRYGLMLNAEGGVIDDAIAYRIAEDEFMLVVNGATREKDYGHIQSHLSEENEIEDISDQTGKIDVQGPEAFKVLRDVLSLDLSDLRYFAFKKVGDLLISRTGYTGELGVEIYADQAEIVRLWKAFVDHDKVLPVGLGARDTLRLECGYSLYGHELDEKTPARYCGVDRFISWDHEFMGKEALLKLGEEPRETFVSFKSANKSAPRSGETLMIEEKEIGVVTSGSLSPSLGHGIGVGRIDTQYAQEKSLWVNKGRRKLEVEVCAMPFYTGSARKKITL